MFFYSDTEPRQPYRGRMPDPIRAYVNHSSNWLYLWFVATRTENFKDKMQALRELPICERKLAWWDRKIEPSRHLELQRALEKLKKDWQFTGKIGVR